MCSTGCKPLCHIVNTVQQEHQALPSSKKMGRIRSFVSTTTCWLLGSTVFLTLQSPIAESFSAMARSSHPKQVKVRYGASTLNVARRSTPTRLFESPQQRQPLLTQEGDNPTTTTFDPLNLSNQETMGDSNHEELGLWAARGILLLVAAIWGTNFAVRTDCFGLSCLVLFSTRLDASHSARVPFL